MNQQHALLYTVVGRPSFSAYFAQERRLLAQAIANEPSSSLRGVGSL